MPAYRLLACAGARVRALVTFLLFSRCSQLTLSPGSASGFAVFCCYQQNPTTPGSASTSTGKVVAVTTLPPRARTRASCHFGRAVRRFFAVISKTLSPRQTIGFAAICGYLQNALHRQRLRYGGILRLPAKAVPSSFPGSQTPAVDDFKDDLSMGLDVRRTGSG